MEGRSEPGFRTSRSIMKRSIWQEIISTLEDVQYNEEIT